MVIYTESPHIIDLLPNLHHFDIAILFNHALDETTWRCPLKMLRFLVVCIASKPNTKSFTKTAAACKNEIKLRLSDGEKGKLCRKGKTCKETMVSLTGNEIMGEIVQDNMALVQIVVSPHWLIVRSLFEWFLYGTDAHCTLHHQIFVTPEPGRSSR